jgi:hypothetical protein
VPVMIVSADEVEHKRMRRNVPGSTVERIAAWAKRSFGGPIVRRALFKVCSLTQRLTKEVPTLTSPLLREQER